MDITVLFKACVKTVRTRNKSLGAKDAKATSLFRKTPRNVCLSKAREVIKQITSLRDFLNDNKKAYLNVMASMDAKMTNVDRNQIDVGAQKIVGACTQLLHELRKEIAGLKCGEQEREHYKNVVEITDMYLKAVGKIYSEQKAIRLKRLVGTSRITQRVKEAPKVPSFNEEVKRGYVEDFRDSKQASVEDEISNEEMQMFESENEILFNELNTLSEEVQQMESKVVHIAELQEVFTEKVLQQEKDIERIATTVVGATENVKAANEQIRQAIQNNAGLRVWVLFFLLVMSFSLLFLDWYND